MDFVFYISAAVAIVATVLAISARNGVHALLYLIVSLLAVAIVFFTLGAAFIAALEAIVYAGAIMVLFVFVVMMLKPDQESIQQEHIWRAPKVWIMPSILALILIVELIYVIANAGMGASRMDNILPNQVGVALLGPYLLGVELASLLLMSGLVGAYHLGHRIRAPGEEQ